MNPNMIPLYGCATLAVMVLTLFVRQNRKSGWKRLRPQNSAEAIAALYSNLGVVMEVPAPATPVETQLLTVEEQIGFSAQMLKLRSALGSSAEVTQDTVVVERELVHQSR